MVVHINRNILMHSGISKELAMFSKRAVKKATKFPHLRLNSTTPIEIMNEITWHMMRKHLFSRNWFSEDGAGDARGFLHYFLPTDLGLPGHTEGDICDEFNSVLDILDVSVYIFFV